MSDTTPTAAVHVPVMLDEVLDALEPAMGGVFVDATFGAGGYTRGILKRAECMVIGIDRDEDALALGAGIVEDYGERVSLRQGRFSQMVELVQGEGVDRVDGVVFDLGVSSMQIDRPERGFSFSKDGPLDMRMSREAESGGPSAADVVNSLEEERLASMLWRLGEERRSRRIARAIVQARREAPIETTGQLAAIIERAMGGRPDKIHPATRSFQALRIYVNAELDELVYGLCAAEHLLKAGGRLVVVSFHSLEDRIVKAFFKSRSGSRQRPSRHLPDPAEDGPEPSFHLPRSGIARPGEREVQANPRSRSARLRYGIRTSAPPIESLSFAPSMIAEA